MANARRSSHLIDALSAFLALCSATVAAPATAKGCISAELCIRVQRARVVTQSGLWAIFVPAELKLPQAGDRLRSVHRAEFV